MTIYVTSHLGEGQLLPICKAEESLMDVAICGVKMWRASIRAPAAMHARPSLDTSLRFLKLLIEKCNVQIAHPALASDVSETRDRERPKVYFIFIMYIYLYL